MERLEFAYHPEEISLAHIAFFTEVTNTAELTKRLQASFQLQGPEGDRERAILNFAFIDAKAVASHVHIKAAVTQATLVCAQHRMASRSLNTEILWYLSPGKSVKDALSRYGISNTTTSLIAVKIGPSSLDAGVTLTSLNKIVDGKLTPVVDIAKYSDYHVVRQYHHMVGDPRLQRVNKVELDRLTENTAVTYTIAKSIVA